MYEIVATYTLTLPTEIMGNGHRRPRDVSGESFLTVTNTLLPYILFIICTVPRVYRLLPAHSCRIMFLIYTLPRDHGVSPTHSCRIEFLIFIWPRVHGASPTHLWFIKYIFENSSICCNQLQQIATDTPNPIKIASPPGSNEAPSSIFCKNIHVLVRVISFE
jgi:hypothetical protein